MSNMQYNKRSEGKYASNNQSRSRSTYTDSRSYTDSQFIGSKQNVLSLFITGVNSQFTKNEIWDRVEYKGIGKLKEIILLPNKTHNTRNVIAHFVYWYNVNAEQQRYLSIVGNYLEIFHNKTAYWKAFKYDTSRQRHGVTQDTAVTTNSSIQNPAVNYIVISNNNMIVPSVSADEISDFLSKISLECNNPSVDPVKMHSNNTFDLSLSVSADDENSCDNDSLTVSTNSSYGNSYDEYEPSPFATIVIDFGNPPIIRRKKMNVRLPTYTLSNTFPTFPVGTSVDL